MSLYQFVVYNRSGTCLYNKSFVPEQTPAQEAEREKLIFGLLFSVKELTTSLSPMNAAGTGSVQCPLEVIHTGSANIHVYSPLSGHRFVAFTAPTQSSIVPHLKKIYTEIWISTVIDCQNWEGEGVEETNFGREVGRYFEGIPGMLK
jgi:hypothetical protein